MALKLILDEEILEELSNAVSLEESRAHWAKPLPTKIAATLKSPGFAPCTVQARQVESLVALGMTTEEISKSLLIDKKLLEFYYDRELNIGAVMVNAKVGVVALKMAMSGDCPEMTKFWLKSRAGWKETAVIEQKVEVTEVSQARQKLLGQPPKQDNTIIEGDATVVAGSDTVQ
jgi:hypothetical protein